MNTQDRPIIVPAHRIRKGQYFKPVGGPRHYMAINAESNDLVAKKDEESKGWLSHDYLWGLSKLGDIRRFDRDRKVQVCDAFDGNQSDAEKVGVDLLEPGVEVDWQQVDKFCVENFGRVCRVNIIQTLDRMDKLKADLYKPCNSCAKDVPLSFARDAKKHLCKKCAGPSARD